MGTEHGWMRDHRCVHISRSWSSSIRILGPIAISRSRFVFDEVGTNRPASSISGSSHGADDKRGSSHSASDDEVINQFSLAPSIAKHIFKNVLPLEASPPLVFVFTFDEGVR